MVNFNVNIKDHFNEFIESFDHKKHDGLWKEQSAIFWEFWNDQIMNGSVKTTNNDYDPIIRLLDSKAKGFSKKTDVAVAMTYVRQGVWYRTFNDLNNKRNIRELLNMAFRTQNDTELMNIVNDLKKANDGNKNGLTGKNANVLNALLFITQPEYFISSVSLKHRRMLIEKLNLGDYDSLKSYGEQVILTNRMILDGLRKLIPGTWSPRTLSKFLYYKHFSSIWQTTDDEDIEESEILEQTDIDEQKSEFLLEKHLEDFLIANWEATTLGSEYDLIEEDGEIKSQQYRTDIGKIDLLVKSKNSNEYAVIELKKGQTNDDTVGQLARYMGWVKKKLSGETVVNGIVIAGSADTRLQYALSVLPNTKLLVYKVNFKLEEI